MLTRLSRLDRFLPVWIVPAMATGLLIGRNVPGVDDALDSVKVGHISLPIASGLLLMMYPVLAKVRYEEIGARPRRPAAVVALAAAQLGDRPGADVRAGLDLPGRPAGVPHRADHHRPGPLHRDGAHLERPGVRRRRGSGVAGGAQLGVPDRSPTPCSARSTSDAAGLARARHPGRRRSRPGRSPGRADLPRHPAARRVPHPPHRRAAPRAATGTSTSSSRGSARSRSTACCSPSSCCSPSRATRSPPSPLDVVRIAIPLLVYFAIMWAGRRSSPARRSRPRLRQDGHAGVHGGGQQLRARDRRRHRRLGRHLRPGAGRGGRTAHRGPGPRRAGLRLTVAECQADDRPRSPQVDDLRRSL